MDPLKYIAPNRKRLPYENMIETGDLKDGFPAASITNPDNFVSLLYYFGMLTISGMHEGKTKLTIPNMVVQEQLYTYLLRRHGHRETCHRPYPTAQDCSGI